MQVCALPRLIAVGAPVIAAGPSPLGCAGSPGEGACLPSIAPGRAGPPRLAPTVAAVGRRPVKAFAAGERPPVGRPALPPRPVGIGPGRGPDGLAVHCGLPVLRRAVHGGDVPAGAYLRRSRGPPGHGGPAALPGRRPRRGSGLLRPNGAAGARGRPPSPGDGLPRGPEGRRAAGGCGARGAAEGPRVAGPGALPPRLGAGALRWLDAR